jgi:hypothetical protein
MARWYRACVHLPRFFSPVAFYWYWLTLLPVDRQAEVPSAVPRAARSLLWRELGGQTSPAMPVLNPYAHFTQPSGPEASLAVSAGRALLKKARAPRPWMPALYSSVIWASRNWSAEEALSTILVRAYYGCDLHGLDAAAQTYLGVSASALTVFETAQLVPLTRSSSRFDLLVRQYRQSNSHERTRRVQPAAVTSTASRPSWRRILVGPSPNNSDESFALFSQTAQRAAACPIRSASVNASQ